MDNDLRILIEYNQDLFPDDFTQWIEENSEIWEAFVKEAIAVANKGFRHYSARTIIHFLRHHSMVSEKGCDWKINDHHSPYLARLFDLRYPMYAGLFEYRQLKKGK